MEQSLRTYLLSLNCKIINSVLEKLGSKNEIGWYCKSSSFVRKDHHMKLIRSFIQENQLPHYITEGNQYTAEFFIYKNK